MLSRAKLIYAFTGTLSKIEEECINSVFKADLIKLPKHNTIKSFQNVLVKFREFKERDQWST
jgi:hypothetical protein